MSGIEESAPARRQILFSALAHQDALGLLRASCPAPTPVETLFEQLTAERIEIVTLLASSKEGPALVELVERFFLDVQCEACRWIQAGPQGPLVWPWPTSRTEAAPNQAALALLSDTSRQLLAELDLKRLLPFLVARATELTGASSAAVLLVDPTNDQLECVEGRGWKAIPPLPLEAGQCQHLLAREPGCFFATRDDGTLGELVRRLDQERVLVSVLRFQNALFGLLVLTPDGDPGWLPLLADLIMVALRNAAHYREVLQRALALSQANEHLQDLDRMKDQFLATISHELRTPLNVISGFGAILQDEEESGPMTEQQRRYLGKMLEGAAQLNHLVCDLLEYSRIQAGKLTIEPEPIDLVPLLQDVADTFGPLAAGSGHTLVLRVDGADGHVHGDAARVRQVVANLLTNAIKFTLPGGTIEIEIRVAGEELVVSVEDDGMGIREDQLPRLFQRFSQMDSGYTRRFGGAGLGLAIARNLVEAHGGRIAVDSPPPGKPKGSRFWFTLPRH
ncbi:MAG TPA: ATP-binding protein [Oscillatoriaceae cyanobacterium]